MTAEEFKKITAFIYDACGIALGEGKEYLIEQRLEPIYLELDYKDATAFVADLGRIQYNSAIKEKIVEAITTNETSFFRDIQPFESFRDALLPQLVDRAVERKNRSLSRLGNKISIWSAASSTGQEAYSLAMIISEYFDDHTGDVTAKDFLITGTDISGAVLAKAISGEYNETDVTRGLSTFRLSKHFEPAGTKKVVKSYLKEMVEFRRLNLMHDFTFLGGFDMIFCRNVLIYFDEDTKKKILKQMYSMLAPGGFLVLGSAESLYGISDEFESVSYGSFTAYIKKSDDRAVGAR